MKMFWIIFLVLTFIGPVWMVASGHAHLSGDYRTANRDSAHISPEPQAYKDAVIQVFSARAFSWRGIIATHCWIAVKPRDAEHYTTYQIVGWRLYHGASALVINEDLPDRFWFNEKPQLILDVRGDKAQALIPKVDAAARSYPYANEYTLWPGPNSNTFPAYVARQVPELGLALPSDAIGKDFLPGRAIFARAPSNTGYQFSLFGMVGLLAAAKEGFEINFLGLVYGVKLHPFAVLLPGIGEGNLAKTLYYRPGS